MIAREIRALWIVTRELSRFEMRAFVMLTAETRQELKNSEGDLRRTAITLMSTEISKEINLAKNLFATNQTEG
jgi:hypothetical protein